ncbi:unnamed protein product [Clavelina lepadiformis]|uniref:Uncharacterized protein n=1 Tax=Clavelina lepadiformis TaxID=159417 RepID=A0ABP0FVQ8_CLALP
MADGDGDCCSPNSLSCRLSITAVSKAITKVEMAWNCRRKTKAISELSGPTLSCNSMFEMSSCRRLG